MSYADNTLVRAVAASSHALPFESELIAPEKRRNLFIFVIARKGTGSRAHADCQMIFGIVEVLFVISFFLVFSCFHFLSFYRFSLI